MNTKGGISAGTDEKVTNQTMTS